MRLNPAVFALLAPLLAAPAADVDHAKLGALHEADLAFSAALAAPDTAVRASDLARTVEQEAARTEHRLSSRAEQYIFDLSTTAALEYASALQKLEAGGSRTAFDSDIAEVRKYLRQADLTFTGRSESSPPPPAPQAAPEPAPAPPAAPAAPPEKPPAVAPPPPPAPQAAPAPPADLFRPEALENMTLNDVRRAANRVKIRKDPEDVAACSLVGEITIPEGTRDGVLEIGGHNFYYGSAKELARFKTMLAGGDTLLRVRSGDAGYSGRVYRCGD